MTTSGCWRLFTPTIFAIGFIASATIVASAQDNLNRTTLPILAPTYKAITEVDARKAKAPPRFEVKAPKDAPNKGTISINGKKVAEGRIEKTVPFLPTYNTGRPKVGRRELRLPNTYVLFQMEKLP